VKSKTRLTNTEQHPSLARIHSKCGPRLSMGLTFTIVTPKYSKAKSIASALVSKGQSFAVTGVLRVNDGYTTLNPTTDGSGSTNDGSVVNGFIFAP